VNNWKSNVGFIFPESLNRKVLGLLLILGFLLAYSLCPLRDYGGQAVQVKKVSKNRLQIPLNPPLLKGDVSRRFAKGRRNSYAKKACTSFRNASRNARLFESLPSTSLSPQSGLTYVRKAKNG
jgi:hypothetical protein